MSPTQSLSKLSLLCVVLSLLSAPAANAQQASDQSQAQERMDKLERDLMLLQRQLARGENIPAPAAGGTVVTGTGDEGLPSNPAQLEIRLSAIEEQLRGLRGSIEENDNRIRKVSESVEKMQKDTDFRFQELSTSAATPQPTVKADGKLNDPKLPIDTKLTSIPANGDKPTGTLDIHQLDKGAKADKAATAESKPDAKAATTSGFASPREHYNYAFRLLNQTQYEESAASFEEFTKKYPKDPLIGNAYYWEGETYYIRRDYVNAADNFRKGFEALPEGPKAADNLLKLAMSLNAVSRDKEACLVLQQIVSKFKKTSSSVADKADQEQKRIGCHK